MTEEILELLQADGRLSYAELANRLNITEAEAQEKITALEKAGIICGYTAIINNENPDSVKALIEVKVAPSRDGGFDRVARRIARYPEVSELCLVSGSFDLLITIRGRSLQEVANFVASKLATIDGVISTSTGFMLKKYKESGRILEQEEDYERLKVTP